MRRKKDRDRNKKKEVKIVFVEKPTKTMITQIRIKITQIEPIC